MQYQLCGIHACLCLARNASSHALLVLVLRCVTWAYILHVQGVVLEHCACVRLVGRDSSFRELQRLFCSAEDAKPGQNVLVCTHVSMYHGHGHGHGIFILAYIVYAEKREQLHKCKHAHAGARTQHTCMHTCIHTYIPAYIRLFTHASMHVC